MSEPIDSDTTSEVDRVGFTLNTTFGLFRGWLLSHTEDVNQRHFPMPEGVLLYLHRPEVLSVGYQGKGDVLALTVGHLRTLPDGRRESRTTNRTWPYLDKDGNETGVSQYLGAVWAIRFKVLPLAAERVEVTAECVEPVVLDYFRELLEVIGELYPEAHDAIHSYLFPEQETDGGGRSAKEAVPSRPREPEQGADFDDWFDWYAQCKSLSFKVTLQDIANKTGYCLSHVKQKRALYLAGPDV